MLSKIRNAGSLKLISVKYRSRHYYLPIKTHILICCHDLADSKIIFYYLAFNILFLKYQEILVVRDF